MDSNEKNPNMNVVISAGDQKIKYFEADDGNCIFEIIGEEDGSNFNSRNIKSEVNSSKNFENENFKNQMEFEEINTPKVNDNNNILGNIIITSIVECGGEKNLQGVRINLYQINGLSPLLVATKITDSKGKVVFSKIPEGTYRVIELVDKRYFEKPKYVNWNEVTINETKKEQKILIVNNLKKSVMKNIGK